MINRRDIEKCNDIEKLKALCLTQRKKLFCIGETLVRESKSDISSEYAIQKIRQYLND